MLDLFVSLLRTEFWLKADPFLWANAQLNVERNEQHGQLSESTKVNIFPIKRNNKLSADQWNVLSCLKARAQTEKGFIKFHTFCLIRCTKTGSNNSRDFRQCCLTLWIISHPKWNVLVILARILLRRGTNERLHVCSNKWPTVCIAKHVLYAHIRGNWRFRIDWPIQTSVGATSRTCGLLEGRRSSA